MVLLVSTASRIKISQKISHRHQHSQRAAEPSDAAESSDAADASDDDDAHTTVTNRGRHDVIMSFLDSNWSIVPCDSSHTAVAL